MKNSLFGLICLCFLGIVFWGCSEKMDTGISGPVYVDTTIIIDTLEYPPDSIFIVDTLIQVDTIYNELPPIYDTMLIYDTTIVSEIMYVYDTSYVYDTAYTEVIVTDTLYADYDGWVIMCNHNCANWPKAVPPCRIQHWIKKGWHIALPGDRCLDKGCK